MRKIEPTRNVPCTLSTRKPRVKYRLGTVEQFTSVDMELDILQKDLKGAESQVQWLNMSQDQGL